MDSSGHSLYLSEDGSHICCYLIGDLSYKRAQVILEELAKFSENAGVYSILVDVTQSTNKANPFENYIIAYRKMRVLKHLLDWRIALLITAQDKSYGFLMTVILNAGYKANMFTTKEEAIKWLKEG